MRGYAYNTTLRVPHPFKDGGAIAPPLSRRPAFSLAEIMIAIGILGVGMLMVASTFPVGLDQCRIVSDETAATMAADEARIRLQLLVQEPRAMRRVGLTWPPAVTTPPFTGCISVPESLALLPVGGPLTDRLLYTAGGVPTTPFNELLRVPYDPVMSLPGFRIGYYPSIPGQHTVRTLLPLDSSDPVPRIQTRVQIPRAGVPVDPGYSWSVLVRRLSANALQAVIFVSKAGAGSAYPDDMPVPVQPDPNTGWEKYRIVSGNPVGGGPIPFPLLDRYGNKTAGRTNFAEGDWLVDETGSVLQIKAIDEQGMTIRPEPEGATLQPWLWHIPASSGGRSPVVRITKAHIGL